MRLVHLCCALALGLTFTPTMSAAEGEGKGHEHKKEGNEPKKEAHDAMKAGTRGTSAGTITSIEKGKLVLHTSDGDLLFMAHWRGGMPKDGGGMDKEMVERLSTFKVGDQVKIDWVWEERRRVEKIEAHKGK